MVYSARALAFLLSSSIAIIAVSCLLLVDRAGIQAIILLGIISFVGSFLLIYYVLEFLIFREINAINKMMEKLNKKEKLGISKEKSSTLNPLKRINEEIYSFAMQKQKEVDELKKLETFRKEFIANVSHELKTPLFAAQGFVHTLLDGAVNDNTVRDKFLKKAAKSLDGLDVLVQDLLTLSQIETGDIKMRFEHIDLYKLCNEVLDQFEEKAAKKNIRLKLEKNKNKVRVVADWQRITQVITNLVSNAISYTPEGGDVMLSFDIGKKNVTTFIADTGEGIPAKHLSRIFERFYRADLSRSRERGGTGLGLAIVKHILEGHNSKPEVESTVGKGSTFSFKLPRSRAGVDGE